MTEARRPNARSKPAPANDGEPKASVRARADAALSATRDATRDLADRASRSVDAAPLAVLAGGIAVGAIAGLLLPRTEQEAQLLGPIGRKLNEGAATAARAARDAGKAELAAAGLSRVGANEQVGKLLESVGKAARSAGEAARESRRRRA